MNKVIEIIKQLQSTSGTNDKIQILKDNKDNELLKKVLYYTYNPFIKYGMSEKTINPIVNNSKQVATIFDVLDKLRINNINDELREFTNMYLGIESLNKDEKELYIMMLLKDLKCNVSSKTINKVWKGLIPQFNVMLANKYFDKPERIDGKEFIITQKLDGGRFIIIKDENGNVKCYTRQGQEIMGMIEFENDFKLLPNNIVIDGELLSTKEGLHSKDLYRETMKEMRKKGEKRGLILHAFDILPFNEFKSGKSKLSCKERKQQLHNLLDNNNFTNIVEVPIRYIGNDKNMITKLLDEAVNNDEEGIMINTADGLYECKRSNEILKVKRMNDVDLLCVGFEEGNGNFKGTLGRINVEYKGNIIGCGSGFELNMRNEIWNNKDKYLNKIVKIQYFEETKNKKDNKLSLRFPVFVEWRFDKDEPSYF